MQSDPRIELTLLAAAAALMIGLAFRLLTTRRTSPADRERRRRLTVDREGRVAQGMLADADDSIMHYAYTVAGVAYNASQDVTALRPFLPADPGTLIGPVQVKYSPRNPPNSIVLCENWSGLRPQSASARTTQNH